MDHSSVTLFEHMGSAPGTVRYTHGTLGYNPWKPQVNIRGTPVQPWDPQYTPGTLKYTSGTLLGPFDTLLGPFDALLGASGHSWNPYVPSWEPLVYS